MKEKESYKIKICYVLEATIGGTRTHLNLLVKYLDQKTFDISVVCSALRETMFQCDMLKMMQKGIHIFEIDMVRHIHPIKDIKSSIKILHHFLKNRYDIVHTHSSKAGVLGRLMAKLANVRIILHSPHAFAFQAHKPGLVRSLYIWIERLMALITTHYIFVSQSEKCIAMMNKICHQNQCSVIPNAVEALKSQQNTKSLKSIFKYPANRFIVGTVGYNRPQKDIPCFLEAAAMILKKRQDVDFLIIGIGNNKNSIEKIVEKYKLKNHVTLLCRETNVLQYYSIMDIFILTSLWEGMPYSVLEAMFYRKPVVATNVVGTRDIIQNNINGILIPPRDPKTLSDTILQLLNNPKERFRLGRNGKRTIIKHHMMINRIHDFEKIYQKFSI